MERKHLMVSEERTFSCEECDYKTFKVYYLLDHIKAVHRKIKEYRCKICDMKTSGKGILMEHIGIKHMGFQNAKEWRKPENFSVRQSATLHPAYEYVKDEAWDRKCKEMVKATHETHGTQMRMSK